MKRPPCWEVSNDRPDYGSSSVCNEEMPEALITLADWSQWSCCRPAWQLHFMTYFFNSAPWDPRWSLPLHSQRRCIHHTFLQIQWNSQTRCCLVQGRTSHSSSESTFLDDFFGSTPNVTNRWLTGLLFFSSHTILYLASSHLKINHCKESQEEEPY